MKDSKGHGSDPRGAHSTGIRQAVRSGWRRDNMGGYVHPKSGWTITPSSDRPGIWNVARPGGTGVFDSHKSVRYLTKVYGGD